MPDGRTVNETANQHFQLAARQAFLIGVHTQTPMFVMDPITEALQLARVNITQVLQASQVQGSALSVAVVVSYEFITPASAVTEDMTQLNSAVVKNSAAFAATAALAVWGYGVPEVEGALLTKTQKAVVLSPAVVFALIFGVSCAGGLAAGVFLGWLIVQQGSRKRQRRTKALHAVVRGVAVLPADR